MMRGKGTLSINWSFPNTPEWSLLLLLHIFLQMPQVVEIHICHNHTKYNFQNFLSNHRVPENIAYRLLTDSNSYWWQYNPPWHDRFLRIEFPWIPDLFVYVNTEYQRQFQLIHHHNMLLCLYYSIFLNGWVQDQCQVCLLQMPETAVKDSVFPVCSFDTSFSLRIPVIMHSSLRAILLSEYH